VLGLLKRHRRAVSPIVTTLFLFAVILGAISVSLGIIYPSVNRLDDQIQLETSGSALQTLDTNIQNLIINGVDSQINSKVKVGIGGALRYNNQIFSAITLLDGGVNRMSTTINQSRLQISQPVKTDWLAQGKSQYFNGEGFQGLLFLNSTTRRLLSWSIINQSRPLGSENVFSSLSYRNIITTNVDTSQKNLQYNLTITIQMVNMTLAPTSRTISSGTEVNLKMRSLGSTSKYTDWTAFSNDVSMVITNKFPESGSTLATERLLKLEGPTGTVSFSVRFQFKYHLIELEF